MKLLLFDIDGTLLTTGGAGEHGFGQAFQDAFGIADDLSTIDFAGATDSAIAGMLFEKHCLEPTPARHEHFRTTYLPHLGKNLARFQGRVMPGVRDWLPDLAARPGAVLGLLTGNFSTAAQLKLTHYGLFDYFPFGAFADDSPHRDALGPIALGRARRIHGVEAFADPARDVLIIGDTPRDIACARACGARMLAVATGKHNRASLSAHGPDFLADDLTCAEAAAAFRDFWEA
ncbi:MAG: HAD hydrolase-like protein [Verrucomicrobia bacterium]|nr:HAD hydrolase-like protein [Verrucomicrobiota bacterium]